MGCTKSEPIHFPKVTVTELRAKPIRRISQPLITINKESSLANHYEILSLQGATNTGTMLTGRDLHSSTIRSILEVSKSTGAKDNEFLQELSILSELDHPNILKVIQTFETNKSYYIVFENADGGEIQNRIKKSCNEFLVGKYMQEIFSAINYIHVHNIIHCDLHIGNLLLSSPSQEAIPKLVGFSYAQRADNIQDVDLENLNHDYVSPEILTGKIDTKTDIWSAGVILYQLLVKKLPFSHKRTKKEALEAIIKGDVDYENPNFKALSQSCQDLIKKILTVNPDDRPSAQQVLADPWLRQSNQDVAMSYEIVQKLRRFKMKTNIVRAILSYINYKIDYKEHSIISLFKKMDVNFDGNISKDEMLSSFKQIGVDCGSEIDGIMENLDLDLSGSLDFSELKIVMIDWEKEIKKKVLAKVFVVVGDSIRFEDFKHELSEILPSEWSEFSKKIKLENGMISLARLKEYIRINLSY